MQVLQQSFFYHIYTFLNEEYSADGAAYEAEEPSASGERSVFEQNFLHGLQNDPEHGIIQEDRNTKFADVPQETTALDLMDQDEVAALDVRALFYGNENHAENDADTAAEQERLVRLGETILDRGGMPSEAQLAAMGMDEPTARGIQSLVWLSKEGDPKARRAVEAMADLTDPQMQGGMPLAQFPGVEGVPVDRKSHVLSGYDGEKNSPEFGMVNAEDPLVNQLGTTVDQQGKYSEDDNLRNHIENGESKHSGRRGVRGAHLKDMFLKNEIQIISSTPHPQIKGVEIIEYRMPKRDKTGTPGTPIPGQYQAGNPKIKAVFDPKVFSTDEYIKRGLEAANNGTVSYPDGVLPREWSGYDNHGVQWRGYYQDSRITSFYPD